MHSSIEPWEDEGFGGEDDWDARESLESDLEDDDDAEPEGAEGEDEDEADGGLDPGS